MERRHIQYEGRVQGVGFRATVRGIAGDFPVSGWVRNEPDGSVTLEAQGEPEDLNAFLGSVRSGLQRHIVAARCDTIDSSPDERGFEIRL